VEQTSASPRLLNRRSVLLAWAVAATALTVVGVYRSSKEKESAEQSRRAVEAAEEAQFAILVQARARADDRARAVARAAVIQQGASAVTLMPKWSTEPRPANPTEDYWRRRLEESNSDAKAIWAVPEVMRLGARFPSQLKVVFEGATLPGAEATMSRAAGKTTSEMVQLPKRISVTLSAPGFDVQPPGPQMRDVSSEGIWNWVLAPQVVGGRQVILFLETSDSSAVLFPMSRTISVFEPPKNGSEALVMFVSRYALTISGLSNVVVCLVIAICLRKT
jgi:hypothetical protein